MDMANEVLPQPEAIEHSLSQLITSIPTHGRGESYIAAHLQTDIVPGLNKQSQSPNFYGFVTGGVTPAARLADHLVTEHDQNVHIHLPNSTLASVVEDAALRMLLELVRLPQDQWRHRTFTTGATGSHVIGLALGREFVVQEAARRKGADIASTAEEGFTQVLKTAGLEKIQILTTVPHSSLGKAASIVGLGRSCIQDVGLSQAKERFNFAALENALKRPNTTSIIAISCAEVNTGYFATSEADMRTIRSLADTHGAWIHVDAAFGLLARCLPTSDPTLQVLASGVQGLELADSITSDAHKLFNVPYDCGIYLSRHLALATNVFQNVGAAYLTTNASDIPSPMNIGIENSRRFRALPVYATLVAYGRQGHQDTLVRQIRLARAIASFIDQEPGLELLPQGQDLAQVYIVILFRASDNILNAELVQRINGMRKIYVSGTKWDGAPAARFAVSNWQVNIERDLDLIKEVLKSILL